MTAAPSGEVSATRRAVAVVVLGFGVASGAAAITILSLIMRAVTKLGGSCSDGGPHVSAQPCPSGIGTALLLAFVCVFACIIGTLWAAAVLRAPMPLLLGWSALFLTLAWNFLEDGFDPPMGEGIAVGFVVCGVVFLLMGVAPLLTWLSVARADRGSSRAPGGAWPADPARKPTPRRTSAGTEVRVTRLGRLAALHASGALTDAEYTRARRATPDVNADR